MAEDFIKIKTKTGKKGVEDGETSKCVENCREESAKCVAVVEESVKEVFKNGKRKALPDGADAKRMKIWKGKRKLDFGMNDVSSEDEDDEETEKSVILSNGNRFNFSNISDVNPGSATGEPQDGELSGRVSSESCFEEEKEIVELQGMESGEETVLNVDNSIAESDLHKEKATKSSGRSHIERVVVTRPEAVHGVGNIMLKLVVLEIQNQEPMEALGMEKLTSELQAHGLKCGGTIQERAARFFLLK